MKKELRAVKEINDQERKKRDDDDKVVPGYDNKMAYDNKAGYDNKVTSGYMLKVFKPYPCPLRRK